MVSTLFLGLFYFSLGLLLHVSHGQFHPPSLFLLIGSGVGFFPALYFLKGKPISYPEEKTLEWMFFSIFLLFLIIIVITDDGLIYASEFAYRPWIQKLILTDLSVAILWILFFKSNRWVMGFIPLILIVTRVLVLFASPKPFHDAFYVEAEAVDFLFKGINPYVATYSKLYSSPELSSTTAFWYPPATLLWLAPFRILFSDVRTAFLFSDVIFGFCLFYIAKKNRVPETLSFLLAMCWLSFLPTYFILEQAWIDSFVLMLVATVVITLQAEKWHWVGFALGSLACSKQPANLAVLFFILFLGKNYGKTVWVKVAQTGFLTLAFYCLPFFIWNRSAFWEKMLAGHIFRRIRIDSLSIQAYLYKVWNLVIPRGPLFAFELLLFLGSIYFLNKQQKKIGLHPLFAVITMLYLWFFLLGPVAFCNYYYFVAGLALLGVVTQEFQVYSKT